MAGDTATTGVWTLVDPIGTAAQPEDDHTVGGSLCFVTGQGSPGGSLGENDVDGGITTLLSPPIDVSLTADPYIGYWRWYNNSAGSNTDDVFTVDVSADGGATWVNVETLGPNAVGGWARTTFGSPNSYASGLGHPARIAGDLGSGRSSRLRWTTRGLRAVPRQSGPSPLFVFPNSTGFSAAAAGGSEHRCQRPDARGHRLPRNDRISPTARTVRPSP